jgi:hypothetical protein
MAKLCNLLARKRHVSVTIVDNHKVVAGSVHLGELNFHGKNVR